MTFCEWGLTKETSDGRMRAKITIRSTIYQKVSNNKIDPLYDTL